MFDQTALLRQNLEEIEACGEAFTASLYARLFTLYPETAHLFANTCMQEQQQKLLMTFVLILDHLDDPAYLAATLRRLGQLHSHYAIQPADFARLGTALLDTFAEHLGPAWTPQHRAVWGATYQQLTAMMLAGYASPSAGMPSSS